ncbi:hypothetical protein EHV15_35520 [Paenibacillus oralis]|uniref:DUF5704 domain-containing protein n=1 Tax=Paenibacillus oralis TaxID=2490856 RepID=A0A3P3TD25_9BACL|nr:hypothetical protein EHV15_35520 [Paenibacillus oralis]
MDRRKEEEEKGQHFADGVEGYRYYFPTLFTITLEPSEGNAIIKHFTTTGKPLDGVEGFKDYTEKLIKNKTYAYRATPGTTNYEYKGYRKSTQGEPSGGPNATGDPPEFTYKGEFSSYYLYFYYEEKDTDEQPDVKCTKPTPEQSMVGKDFSPNASAVIKADNRGNERFDVADGIPTSESLYGNVTTKEYLYNHKYNKMVGTCTFTVPVTRNFNLHWKELVFGVGWRNKSEDVTLTYDAKVTKPYAYWAVDEFHIYEIVKATLLNYAFDGGGITIVPTGYEPPDFVLASYTTHIKSPPVKTIVLNDKDIDGGTKRPDIENDTRERGEMEAEGSKRAPKLFVRNDLLEFEGQTIINDAWAEEKTEMPGKIPEAKIINDNVLYSPNHTIPTSKTNKANQPSSGTIYYELMAGSTDGDTNKNFPINGINSVTVHTPVVIYPSVSDDKAHNQKTKPAKGRSAIILDRPFTVDMPNSGQHTNYLGYGNRNYLKYIGGKQVRFPFDVYNSSKTKFYPKHTWIEVDKEKESFTFYLPVWVDEGYYDVEFRTIAHNAPSGATNETNANLDLKNHIAYDTVPVDAIGRVYDFRVTDIADLNWESVFRIGKGSSASKGTSYWVGLKGIDGAANGSTYPYVLPILRGSHPLPNYKNVSVKSGYHFKFDLKTKGNMFGDTDAIRITPTFYFQDNDPKTSAKRIPVDLYYHSDTQKFVKVGSAADVERREIVLNERLRNVPYTNIVNTAGTIYDLSTGWNITRNQYVSNFIKRSSEPTYVGGYDVHILPSPLRTFINTFDRPSNANATPARVNASIQQWYGEYSLPAAVYVVPKGTDLAEYGRKNRLDEKSPIFLRNGYITVNFNIETIRNADLSNPYLQYIHGPLNNQWWDMEGYDSADDSRDHIITDPYGVQFNIEDGDVIFYDANLSSYDDFAPKGTH